MWASPPTHCLPKSHASHSGGQSSAPTHAYRTRTLSLSCHSEPVLTLAWESVPPVPASLTEGGVTAKGRDGGRDMPRQRRGTRGDVGIAPYAPSIEHPRCSCVVIPRARSARGNPSPFHVNSGQRPPPTFAASRQRRDLIIANPRRVFPKREGRSPPSLVAQGWGIFKGEGRSKLPSPLNGAFGYFCRY